MLSNYPQMFRKNWHSHIFLFNNIFMYSFLSYHIFFPHFWLLFGYRRYVRRHICCTLNWSPCIVIFQFLVTVWLPYLVRWFYWVFEPGGWSGELWSGELGLWRVVRWFCESPIPPFKYTSKSSNNSNNNKNKNNSNSNSRSSNNSMSNPRKNSMNHHTYLYDFALCHDLPSRLPPGLVAGERDAPASDAGLAVRLAVRVAQAAWGGVRNWRSMNVSGPAHTYHYVSGLTHTYLLYYFIWEIQYLSDCNIDKSTMTLHSCHNRSRTRSEIERWVYKTFWGGIRWFMVLG